MKIKKIKINQYGKLENKEIKFEKINLIYGKNESGKSTLLNFIESMFFGISKNKNGKSMSDYEKYKPWNEKEFSGQLEYRVENQDIKIYRDFNKRNPEIYDENEKNISPLFKTDKKNGIQPLKDQCNLDREILKDSSIIEQKNIELDSDRQSQLLQKIANLAESGDEEISYKKTINKLDKILLTEVGTDKSQERPLNIARKNIESYKLKLDETKKFRNRLIEIENDSDKLKKELEEEIKNKKIYKEIKDALDEDTIENEKIKIKEKIIEENDKKIKRNKNEIEQIKDKKQKNKRNKIILIVMILLLNIVSFIWIKNRIINIAILAASSIILIMNIIRIKKYNYEYLNGQVNILTKNSNELKKEIELNKEKLINKNKAKKRELVNKYGSNVEELFTNEINEIINDNTEIINKLNLEMHKLELEKTELEPKVEELLTIEENLYLEEEKIKQLEHKSYIMNKTKLIIEEAYEEMKNSIAPKVNEKLSENIEKISDGKYKKIILNDGIYAELNSGKKVEIDKLSEGTIEQIYLALRLSVLDEISKEKLPIILDEVFAYYDDDRLKQTLKSLNKLENQIILFTCSSREKKILDKLKIEYNYTEL